DPARAGRRTLAHHSAVAERERNAGRLERLGRVADWCLDGGGVAGTRSRWDWAAHPDPAGRGGVVVLPLRLAADGFALRFAPGMAIGASRYTGCVEGRRARRGGCGPRKGP